MNSITTDLPQGDYVLEPRQYCTRCEAPLTKYTKYPSASVCRPCKNKRNAQWKAQRAGK